MPNLSDTQKIESLIAAKKYKGALKLMTDNETIFRYAELCLANHRPKGAIRFFDAIAPDCNLYPEAKQMADALTITMQQ